MNYRLQALSFAFLLCSFAVGQVVAVDEKTETESAEKLTSVTEDRRDILNYGIDDEVSGLLQLLKEERDETSLQDAFAVFQSGVSQQLKIKFLEYFKEMEFRGAEDIVIADMENYEDLDSSYLLASISYLSTGMNPNAVIVYRAMLESDDTGIVRAAVKALGGSGRDEDAAAFLEYLDDAEFPVEVKPEIILSLGELANPIARDRLIEIIEDEYEDKSWRMYACVSLAKIGFEEDVAVLRRVYENSDDPLLRSYAISSLGLYATSESEVVLIQSLRDSFWRVRVNAAKALGERESTEAVPILIYKATKDPEVRVRIEAITALGFIGTREAFDAIQKIYKTEGADMKLRSAALSALATGDIPSSIGVFEEVIAAQWEKKQSAILEVTAKQLSRTEAASLEPIFELFLSHPELTVKIHGIRGIRRNRFAGLKDQIEALSEEGNHRSIRKEALAALEEL